MNYEDAEYRRSNAASSSGAISAWNAGATGRNVTVAVIDSGINPNLPEFAGRIHPASQDVAASRGVVDNEGHGTAVAGTIGAARNGSGPVGVAFESRILSLNTSNPNNCTEEKGCKHGDSAIGQAIDIARANGARVINISLGGDGAGSAVLSAVARASQAGVVIVMSAGNDSEANPSTFATASASRGNGHVIIAGSVGAPIGGDPTNGTDLAQLSDFSNAAGNGANVYLGALGYRVRTFDENGTGYLYSGTSFAAPVISGAAALLASAFPNLTGRQIVEILFTTADDLGAASTDSRFGRGRLNITRAMQPVGRSSIAGTATPVSTTSNGSASGTTGDALGRAQAGAVILDGFSRAFAIDLARTLSAARQESPLAQGLQGDLATGWASAGHTSVSITMRRNLAGQPQVGLAQTGMSYEDSRRARAIAGMALSRIGPDTKVALGFSESGRTLQQRLAGADSPAFLVARDPLTRSGFHADSGASVGIRRDLGPAALTVTAERGDVWSEGPVSERQARPGYSIGAIALDRRLGDLSLTLSASRMREEATVLGGRFSFAPGGSTSWFADATVGWENREGWGAQASYRRGVTRLPAGAGIARGGRLGSDAFSLDLWRSGAFAGGDRLAFRAMQPLRVASGGYRLNLPVSYDYATGTAGHELRTLNLSPSGRELDFEASYGLPLFGGTGWLTANGFVRREPGHVAAMETDRGAALRLSLGF